MCILGKDFGDDDPRYQQALKYDDLLAIQKQPWVRSATPAVSKSLRLRANNIDVAASAEGSVHSILMSTA